MKAGWAFGALSCVVLAGCLISPKDYPVGELSAGGAGSESGGTAGVGSRAGGASGQAGRASGGSGSAASAGSGGRSGNAGQGGAGSAGSASVNPCDRSHWQATASKFSNSADTPELYCPPAYAIDAESATRWTTGAAQTGGEWFQLDLGAVAGQISEVTLGTGAFPGDFPAFYRLEISDDGQRYNMLGAGAGNATTKLTFSPRSGRYLRITQTGSSASWWSITDLSVTCK